MDAKIQTLQNSYEAEALRSQVDSFRNEVPSLAQQVARLQQKVIQLETSERSEQQNSKDLLTHSSYFVSEPSQPLKSSKTIQHDNSTMNGKKAPYLIENDPKRSSAVLSEIKDTTSRGKDIESNVLSEDSRIHFKNHQTTQEYNLYSNQKKGLNEQNFITSEDNFVDDVPKQRDVLLCNWQSPGRIPEQERIEIIQTGFQRQAQGIISLKKYYESTGPNSLFKSKGYSIKYETIRRNKLYQQFKP